MTREEAIKIIENIPALRYEMDIEHSVHSDLANALYMAIEALKELPRVHAHWIEYERPHYFKCSRCKLPVPYKKAMLHNGARKYNFCPSCGAIMDEEDEQ